MGYAVAVKWKCQHEAREKVLAAAVEFEQLARAEDGCLFFQYHTDPEDADTVFIYELYRDEAAFERHIQTEHFERLVRQGMLPLLAARERHFYRTL